MLKTVLFGLPDSLTAREPFHWRELLAVGVRGGVRGKSPASIFECRKRFPKRRGRRLAGPAQETLPLLGTGA